MDRMIKRYLPVIKNTWSEYMIYRLNFVLWRVRIVLRLLTIYFLWTAIFRARTEVFGYEQKEILTYILLGQILSATVFSTKTPEVGNEINDGRLSNFLLKPLNYFKYWWARDFSDKLLNIIFSIVEVSLIVFLLKPAVVLQNDPQTLFLFFVSVLFSGILYFYISFLLSLSGFWTADVWAPRFIFFIITDFFSGGLFPLDILPEQIFFVLRFLPFTYLQFFPLKIYLGDLAEEDIFLGMGISLFWIIIVYIIVKSVWQKGLRLFEAQGR